MLRETYLIWPLLLKFFEDGQRFVVAARIQIVAGEIVLLLADRDRLYGRANAVVDTSGKTVRQSLAELRRAIA